MNGIIIRGLGGFYYVECQGTVYECRAAGKFRLSSITPRVGDIVTIELQSDGTGFIIGIEERKNQLIRPAVANVDMLVVVLAKKPSPDYLLCDKILVDAAALGIDAVICVNKNDLIHSEIIAAQYITAGYEVYHVSSLTHQGICQFSDRLKGIICFAGQSGVGKSSLLNCLLQKDKFEIGAISKIERGKHTTREVQLIRMNNNASLIDTPGFSVLDLRMEPEQMRSYYLDFSVAGPCRFDDCIHVKEDGCAVRECVKNGKISSVRYENYLKIMEELQEARRKKYD